MKNVKLFFLVFIAVMSVSFTIDAYQEKINKAVFISVNDGYVRETIPGTHISSAYMTINNNSEKSVTLVGASSTISPRIEIHQHSIIDGMMRMRQLDSITIKGKESVILQPSGLHLMIFDFKKPLIQGETIDLTLHFLSAPDLQVQLPISGIKIQNEKQHYH
ncbi:MAG: copper chaperone PCu(A)C [Colwellia sp.]